MGASVALLARGESALREVADEIAASGSRALAVPTDLAQPNSVESAKAIIERELGTPSILINAAGVFGPIDLVKDGDPAAWIETIQINAIAPYLTCRAFVAGMIALGW